MQQFKYILSLIGIIQFTILGQSQNLLTLDDAIQKALQNNHQIQLKKYDVEIQEKQVNPALVGRRPVVQLNASYELGWADAEVETLSFGPDGEQGTSQLSLDGISNDIIVGPEVNMLLLDGKASKYRLEQLGMVSEIAQLELQQTIEQTIADVTFAYLQMAQQESLIRITTESITLSQERLDRAQQDATYGTSSSLESLQIEVDLKTDSASLRNLALSRDNAQRNLNRLMNEKVEMDYSVETDFPINNQLNIQELVRTLTEKSTILQLSERNIQLSDLEIQLAQSAYQPTLQGYVNMNYVYLQDDANFLQSNRTIGPNIGVRMQYKIFDGGARKIQEQTAILERTKDGLAKESTEADLLTELNNAYATYQNNLQQWRIEESNLPSFERNLENLQNRYKLGTATNTDVRAAQLNLNAAKNRINNYQYTIKQSEVALYLLAGMLVE